MKILHTSELYAPSVGGAQEVVRQISERLVGLGHDVTVATTRIEGRTGKQLGGVRIEEFSIYGNAVRGYTGETERYLDFLRQSDFDVMLNYAAQEWTADLAFEVLGELPYRKVLAPCGFSGLRLPAYSAYFERMPDVLRGYDRLVLHSTRYQDAVFARQHGLANLTVIPNGAAAEEFDNPDAGFRTRHRIPNDVPLLLTIGTHSGLKGHGLAIDAFRKTRIGRSVLLVIGNKPQRLGCWPNCVLRAGLTTLASRGNKRVLLLDPRRSEVVSALAAADLFVFGSNVECAPLVLYEAMAAGTPFLSVACGNAPEIAELGGGRIVRSEMRGDGRIVGDSRVMAHSIEDLIHDRAARKHMGHLGRDAWRANYRWDLIVGQYELLYERLVRGGGSKQLTRDQD